MPKTDEIAAKMAAMAVSKPSKAEKRPSGASQIWKYITPAPVKAPKAKR